MIMESHSQEALDLIVNTKQNDFHPMQFYPLSHTLGSSLLFNEWSTLIIHYEKETSVLINWINIVL